MSTIFYALSLLLARRLSPWLTQFAPAAAAEVFKAIRTLAATGLTLVWVTDDTEAALALSDRVVLMAHGKVRLDATPEAFRNAPEARSCASS